MSGCSPTRQWIHDWKFWFRISLIGYLLVYAGTARSEDAPRPDDVFPKPEAGLPILITPDAEAAPAPKSKTEAEIEAEERAKPAPVLHDGQPHQGIEAGSKLLPLPDSATRPAGPDKVTSGADQTLVILPEPEPEIAPEPEPAEAEAAPEPATLTTEESEHTVWRMLITPGVSTTEFASQAGTCEQENLATLVTFQLDPETGQTVGAPSELAVHYGPLPSQSPSAVQKYTDDDAEDEEPSTTVHPGTAYPGTFPQSESDIRPRPLSLSPGAYQQVYDSIPFSRAEYLANPAFRHEATMEILFGEMRPTVVHKQDTPRRIYNLPPIHEDPRHLTAPSQPFPGTYPGWHRPYWGPTWGPYWGAGRYFAPGYGAWWTPNSTYRRHQVQYGPLFNSYYQPLTRPWGW